MVRCFVVIFPFFFMLDRINSKLLCPWIRVPLTLSPDECNRQFSVGN